MRLLTRSDFDGLACGALLKEVGVIDSWKFVHPKDMQEGLVEVTENDVLANVPYVKGCKMWFDHHTSENERLGSVSFTGASHFAPSCARVIYEYYGGDGKLAKFKKMVGEVDKVDSGDLGIKDIMEPEGWVLLGLVMDPRTGLGRFKDFAISNYELMEKLIDACRTMTIEEIIALPDVQERVKLYWEQNEVFKDMLERRSKVDGNVIATDLRGVGSIAAGNRFLVYSLFPEQNISVWVVDGKERNCAIAVGHSIVNRTSNTNVGSLLLKYGGGGHRQVGTCQVDYDEADRIINELVERMKKDG